MPVRPEAPIERLRVRVFTVPTDAPESDGTLEWTSTTMVLVEAEAGGATSLGYTYAGAAAGRLVADKLADAVAGTDALDTPAAFAAMCRAIRNEGRPGVASTAISAVDTALWDLKAKLLGVSVAALLGRARERVPLYGSGGFTSYDDRRLAAQLGGWAEAGFGMVKMKIGREPDRDPERVRVAREAIGPDCRLFVDANGALTRKDALLMAERIAPHDVRWFEEPVSSDDLEGLRLMRDRAPAGMAISAGEYGYDPWYFRRMLAAEAVDVIQADATRCGGVTGFLQAADLAHAFQVPLSSHCAPALHLPLCAAALNAVHAEWFYDHARIEALFFDGAPEPKAGHVAPDLDRLGLGLTLKEADAKPFAM